MVENERSIFRNTAFSTAGRGAGDLFAFLFLIVFARHFGSDALGEFAFAMAIGALLAAFVSLGVNSMLVREIAKAPAEGPRLVGAMAGHQLLIGAAMFGILFLLSRLLADGERSRQILLVVGLYQLLYALGTVFTSYFRAREQTQFGAGLEAGHKAAILVLGLLAIFLIGQPEVALLAYPLAGLAMYAAGFALLQRQHATPRLHLDWSLSRNLIIASLPLFAYQAVAVLRLRAGIIFLGSTGDAAAVGMYAAGDRLVTAASLLFLMFNGAVLPVMSRLTESRDELRQLLARCLRLAVTLALPVATVIVLFRGPIIELAFGAAFLPAADVLGILALSMVPAAISGICVMLLIARDRLSALLKIQLLGLVVFLAAMGFLARDGNYTGLAWAVLLAKLVVCIATVAYQQRYGDAVPLWPMLRGPLAAAGGMLGAFMLSTSLPLMFQVTVTVAAGAAMLVAFKGIELHDLAYLRRIIGRTA